MPTHKPAKPKDIQNGRVAIYRKAHDGTIYYHAEATLKGEDKDVGYVMVGVHTRHEYLRSTGMLHAATTNGRAVKLPGIPEWIVPWGTDAEKHRDAVQAERIARERKRESDLLHRAVACTDVNEMREIFEAVKSL